MKIRKDFTFDAAHNLIKYHGKCERLHGHTYKLAVILEGSIAQDGEDMIIDFCEISSIVKSKIISRLDHCYINDLISQPTAENIALWIWHELEHDLERENCRLFEIRLWETATSCVIINREDIN
ncbi:MAG: 6-carboxytetrahydropterin synthase QueD [Synergistaceae bacterium]|nr:6-carboxytetrahydropterin synthase QueD [Synergistaceae bacterium]MBR0220654.1 6-carboxytetrahydropterin synthase QueD [Synergistaceae bacterium]